MRLISNLPPSSPPPTAQFPSLVCALSNMVWCRKREASDANDMLCREETFRSLVELAFSLDPGSRYKMSLNALLCALCRQNPRHYSMLLASCDDVLSGGGGGGGGGGVERLGHRLNTLALASQSPACSRVLLDSELVGRMVSRLTNGFEKLLDMAAHFLSSPSSSPSSPHEDAERENMRLCARDILASLSSLLAFFTDFLCNWRLGKEWLACTDNHRFWPPMIEFLSLEPSIVSPLEVAFLQEVVYNFFGVALLGCELTKRTFVRLVCDALCGEFHFGSRQQPRPVLSPFLHKLFVGLLFQHECLPIILKVVSPPPPPSGRHQDREQELWQPLLSLPSTCEVLDFHPSHPVGETCYWSPRVLPGLAGTAGSPGEEPRHGEDAHSPPEQA